MDRREFVAAVGAGTLFPADIVKALVEPKVEVPCSKKKHDGVYPIYYTRNGTQEVYRIWHPRGFVFNIGRHLGKPYGSPLDHLYPDLDCHRFAVYLRKTEGRGFHRIFSSNYVGTVFSRAPAGSLVVASRHEFDNKGMMFPISVKGDFGIPYLGTGEFWHRHKRGRGPDPFLLTSKGVRQAVVDGLLYEKGICCSLNYFLTMEDSGV